MADDFRGRTEDVRPSNANRTTSGSPDTATREAVDEAKAHAASLAREAQDKGKAVLGRQKDGAAEKVDHVAGALHAAADDLQDRGDAQAGRFVSYAARRLESWGGEMRHKDIDTLIHDAERLGRQSPAAFFAGSVAVGFLLARFLKSSATARDQDRDDDEARRRRRQTANAVVPVSAPYEVGSGAATGTSSNVNRPGSTASSSPSTVIPPGSTS